MIKHWTPEEDKLLLELKIAKVPYKEIAAKLGRTLEAVRTRSKRFNISTSSNTRRTWTDEQIALLYEPLDYDELEKLLPYSRRGIMAQCEKRGISKRYARLSRGTMREGVDTWLYLVDFGEFKKVGVTQVSLEVRFVQDPSFILLDKVQMNLDEALYFEQEILRSMRPYKVVGNLHRGSHECFNFEGTVLEDFLLK